MRPRSGTKLYIQLFSVSIVKRPAHVSGVMLSSPLSAGEGSRGSIFTALARSLAFYDCRTRSSSPSSLLRTDDIDRKMEITFQFLFTIDEASYLDFYAQRFRLASRSFHNGARRPSAPRNGSSDNKNIRFMNCYYNFLLTRGKTCTHTTAGSIMKIGINCFASDGIQRGVEEGLPPVRALTIWTRDRAMREASAAAAGSSAPDSGGALDRDKFKLRAL
jgi:hypothetical protein